MLLREAERAEGEIDLDLRFLNDILCLSFELGMGRLMSVVITRWSVIVRFRQES